jgi:hypothetical protein
MQISTSAPSRMNKIAVSAEIFCFVQILNCAHRSCALRWHPGSDSASLLLEVRVLSCQRGHVQVLTQYKLIRPVTLLLCDDHLIPMPFDTRRCTSQNFPPRTSRAHRVEWAAGLANRKGMYSNLIHQRIVMRAYDTSDFCSKQKSRCIIPPASGAI